MIIGLDKENYIVSVGKATDTNAYSKKVIDDTYINLATNIYKYERGHVVDLGLKPELTKTQEERIIEKLEVYDQTVDRQWEDYYIREQVEPVERIATVIAQKQELRQELQELLKRE